MTFTYTTYSIQMSKSHYNHIHDMIPIEMYSEELEFLENNWKRDIKIDFLSRFVDDIKDTIFQNDTDTLEIGIVENDDLVDDETWGTSDWADFLGCDQDNVDEHFQNQMC